MLKGIFEGGATLFMVAFFMVLNFPGGTIVMALGCNHSRLSGLDWVLSVVIPGYGLATTLFSSACMG